MIENTQTCFFIVPFAYFVFLLILSEWYIYERCLDFSVYVCFFSMFFSTISFKKKNQEDELRKIKFQKIRETKICRFSRFKTLMNKSGVSSKIHAIASFQMSAVSFLFFFLWLLWLALIYLCVYVCLFFFFELWMYFVYSLYGACVCCSVRAPVNFAFCNSLYSLIIALIVTAAIDSWFLYINISFPLRLTSFIVFCS